jgi:excisionase family DNA binding protein
MELTRRGRAMPNKGTRSVFHPSGISPLMTIDEVADFLRKSTKAVYAMVSRGQLPGVIRLGRQLRFRRDDIEDLAFGRAPSQRGRR